MKVLLIHGLGGAPNGGWRPYVMKELATFDISTTALLMPSSNEPRLEAWLQVIRNNIDIANDDVVLVGHSLGGTTVMRYLERYVDERIKKIILVSTPYSNDKHESLSSFFTQPFDWQLIKNQKIESVVIHGDNDPIVPFTQAEHIAHVLSANLISIPNGLHLNGGAGVTELPAVVNAIITPHL